MTEIGQVIKRQDLVELMNKGVGIYEYPNGDRYEGEWNDDNKEGTGKN